MTPYYFRHIYTPSNFYTQNLTQLMYDALTDGRNREETVGMENEKVIKEIYEKMTKRNKRQKRTTWIKPHHKCGCQITFSRSGAIELDKVIFCDKHLPLRIEKWTAEDRLAHIIENLEVKKETVIWELKHGINDSCFHCEKEHAISKRGILKQFIRLLQKIGTKDGRIMSVRKSKCPFCDKTNFLYCEIINFKRENVSGWDYYPFPTKEHVEAYTREMKKGNIENAQMYKPKGIRRMPKSYIA